MKKTVVITGGATGIGKATAEKFAKCGYNVCFLYNNSKPEAEALEKELSKITDVFSYKVDVRDKEETDAFIKKVIEKFGRIDVLVNNAGIAPKNALFTDTEKSDWEEVFGVNLFGVFNVTKAALPFMIHEKKGAIVNVSSIWGIVGASCEVVYSSSKAALIGFSKALSKELAPSFIRVNTVAPGVIKTRMNDALGDEEKEDLAKEIPLGRWGDASEIADLIYFLSSDEAKYITGQTVTCDGGFIGV